MNDMANIKDLKDKAAAIKGATVPESVSAPEVGGLFEDVIDFAGQAAADVEKARSEAVKEISDRAKEEDSRISALEKQMNNTVSYRYGYDNLDTPNTAPTNTWFVANIDENHPSPKRVSAITFKAKTGVTSFYVIKFGKNWADTTVRLIESVENETEDDGKFKTITVDIVLEDGESVAISGDYYYNNRLDESFKIKYVNTGAVSVLSGRNEAYYIVCQADEGGGLQDLIRKNTEDIKETKDVIAPLPSAVESNAQAIKGINDYIGGERVVKYADLEFYEYGYISNNVINKASSHCLVKLKLGNVEKVTITSKIYTTLTFATIRTLNDEFVAEYKIKSAGTPLVIDTKEYDESYYMLLSWYDYANSGYTDEATVVYYGAISKDIENKLKGGVSYRSMVRKPFAFVNKRILFCGDSITRGYINGSTTTANGYPKLFAEAVGATFVNAGVGGTTLSISSNGTIQTQIQNNKDGGFDFLFVAGGINDWQLGVDLATFKSAVETICTFINANYPQTTKVIFITPINHAGWDQTHSLNVVAEVQEYRDIITRVVMENDAYMRFSIVQGTDLNFPTADGDAEYKSLMFGDLLHPSQLGYNTLYLAGLLNVLC